MHAQTSKYISMDECEGVNVKGFYLLLYSIALRTISSSSVKWFPSIFIPWECV